MTTFQHTSSSEAPPDVWHQALTAFRARAQELFEAQQERVRFLEEAILEQLEDLEESPSAPDSESAPDSAGGEEQDLRTLLAKARKQLNVRAEELKRLRAQVAVATSDQPDLNAEQLLEELSELRMERDQLVARVADAEHGAQQTSAGDSAELDELRTRFEKAVQEIRELKTKNTTLEASTAQGRNSPEPTLPAASGFNWEEQKRRLMQELDGDHPAGGGLPQEDRHSIESTIRITDEVVAHKDRELAELRALLNDPAAQVVATNEEGPIAELLDRDEVIQAEREKLKRLQEEWREKLRQAEIDLSVERAKLARGRAELEERVRVFEAQQAAFGGEAGDAASDRASQKRQSGRWLSRLGLKDDNNK